MRGECFVVVVVAFKYKRVDIWAVPLSNSKIFKFYFYHALWYFLCCKGGRSCKLLFVTMVSHRLRCGVEVWKCGILATTCMPETHPILNLHPWNAPMGTGLVLCLRCHGVYWPISQIHNASGKYPTMHHFVTEMCTFLLQNGALLDMEMVHYGICATGLFRARAATNVLDIHVLWLVPG